MAHLVKRLEKSWNNNGRGNKLHWIDTHLRIATITPSQTNLTADSLDFKVPVRDEKASLLLITCPQHYSINIVKRKLRKLCWRLCSVALRYILLINCQNEILKTFILRCHFIKNNLPGLIHSNATVIQGSVSIKWITFTVINRMGKITETCRKKQFNTTNCK